MPYDEHDYDPIMNDKIATIYDAFPYDSLAIKQTHPIHLYQIAQLCGLDAIHTSNAKVLELGCASGGNLIPMAYHFPGAKFWGIDLSGKQIASGLEMVHELNLTNIQLKQQSLIDFQSEQTFDYIICHGLFSWVPIEVQNHVFALCQQYLSKNGVAYISYNTLPGWHIGNIVRDQLQAKTQDIHDPILKVQYARRLLRDLSIAVQSDPSPYSHLLQNEIALTYDHSDNQLLHEQLSPYNHPMYFNDFIQQAEHYQLQYLSDAFLSNDELADSADNLQALDILKNRRFRCSLLCRQQAVKMKSKSQKMLDNFEMSFPVAKNVKFEEKPRICPLVRYQIDRQDVVTNHRHENITLSPTAEVLIPYLDGTNDIAKLVKVLINEVEQGELILVDKQGREIMDNEIRYQYATKMCEETLILMATSELLLNTQYPL